MERLLNVREAAEILNVSEMTIRRWTNAGLLSCYRIGNKRERRFSPLDLRGFLDSGRMPPAAADPSTPSVPLGMGGFEVPDGAHLTHLYSDAQEAQDLQEGFVRRGLEDGETVLLVATEDRRARLLDTLSRSGLDIPGLTGQGRLHHAGGAKRPAEQWALISRIAASARGRFRLIGEMSWTKHNGWRTEQIRSLEDHANHHLRKGSLCLCQYALRECSGEETMMAVETHQFVIYRGSITPGFLGGSSTPPRGATA